MTNIELVERAEAVYKNADHWTYCQGALGETANSARVKGLYTYYRSKNNGSTCDYNIWLPTYGTAPDGSAKQCTDCSNFIQYLIQSGKNAAASYYTNMQDAGDPYTAPVGAILLVPGKHVGIVVQQGIKNADGTWKQQPLQIDFYAYNNTCRRATYLGGAYTKAVYLKGINYGIEPEPVSLSATVKAPHKIGDVLTAADFDVFVKMSDGSTRQNPPGWAASPLAVTADMTEIKVVYKGLSCTIPVQIMALFE